MKRKEKTKKKNVEKEPVYKKNIYELLGVGPEILSNEVKIVIVGDYIIQFHNHNGIIDISDTCIKINTKKSVYTVNGERLRICSMSDEEVDIKGKIISISSE